LVWVDATDTSATPACCVGHINTQKTTLAAASAQIKPVTPGMAKFRKGLRSEMVSIGRL
jgi:hypothetical protein